MTSTSRTSTQPAESERAESLSWRSWPLVDHRGWSWAVPTGILAIGGTVWYLGGGWLLAFAAVVGLAGTLWQFFVPFQYEITPLGLRRHAIGRTRLIAWHSIRAFQLRPTGVLFYQRSDATKLDLMRSLFVPYPPDEDELLCAIRQHLPHAVELPK